MNDPLAVCIVEIGKGAVISIILTVGTNSQYSELPFEVSTLDSIRKKNISDR